MTVKVTRKVRQLQDAFFDACVNSTQTLEEIIEDLGIPHQTLAGWLIEPNFRVRLHGLRRYLRRARDLQIEMGALHASAMLLRTATDTAITKTESVTRSACVDLIRLARDSHARARVQNSTAEDETKRRALYHPDVPADEARELIEELARRDANEKAAPSPSYPGERAGVTG